MEDSLKKRYIIKLLANFISGIVNILIIAIVPKSLGPVAFGQFTFIQQFFNQLIGFLDASTSIAFFTKLSANQSRKELITFYFIFILLLLIVLYITVFFIDRWGYADFLLPDIPSNYIYFGLLFGFLTWVTQIYIKISDAYAMTVSSEIIKIVHKTLSLVLLLFLISLFTFDLTLYFYFNYTSIVLFLLAISILFIRKKVFNVNLLRLKLHYVLLIKEFYKFVSPLFLFNTIAIMISLFDIWLLQKMSGSIQTGYYGLSYSIAAMCFLFTGAMTPIITREFSKSFENSDIETMKVLFKKYVPMLYAIAAYFGVFISFQSENILLIFTGNQFTEAFKVLMIMAFFPVHQTYGQLNSSVFFSTGKTKIYSLIGISISISGLILSYILLVYYNFGAEGFAWKMILMQIVSTNIQLYFNVKFLKVKMTSFVVHQIYILLFFSLIAYFSCLIPNINENPLLNVLLQGFFYTLCTLLLLFIIPNAFSTNRNELFAMIKQIKEKVVRNNV